jgi:hypothetical protein
VLLSRYHAGQVSSPSACLHGQVVHGSVYLLPTLSFGSGNKIFRCRIRARAVLLDLGGAVATEDNDPNDTYTLSDGKVLRFTRQNLEPICDDALKYFPAPAPATVDGDAISGVQVSTAAFIARVNRHSGTYWQQSVALGHPGRLAASYCGWKAVVHLHTGHHVIKVDLSRAAGAPTHFVYRIDVAPSQRHHDHD